MVGWLGFNFFLIPLSAITEFMKWAVDTGVSFIRLVWLPGSKLTIRISIKSGEGELGRGFGEGICRGVGRLDGMQVCICTDGHLQFASQMTFIIRGLSKFIYHVVLHCFHVILILWCKWKHWKWYFAIKLQIIIFFLWNLVRLLLKQLCQFKPSYERPIWVFHWICNLSSHTFMNIHNSFRRIYQTSSNVSLLITLITKKNRLDMTELMMIMMIYGKTTG